jgi:hypothetical protein
MKMDSGFESVTPVVALTRCHPNALRMWRHGHGQPGRGQPSLLHQWNWFFGLKPGL